jgi:alkyl sulfatase BDS1-like metallo-beta-lactamase superfamily hydrolase
MRLRRFAERRPRERGQLPARDLAGQVLVSARQAVRERGQAGLCRLMGRASDPRLEQIFAGGQAQRAAFAMMTRHFDPAKADGFDGAIVYDLVLTDGTRRSWAIEVHDGQVWVRPGGSADAALTVMVPLADFIRVLTTSGSFYPMLVDGRMTMKGDLALADRLPGMFGVVR